ncbi:hypothetical protein F5X68DRAFT_193436 [Plectosphaerella plurivora]|uniref:Uncharacterized protein n=1 Tax=Plectosphaerella plurivora TaxID=936078 RepID=A0A9P9A5T2_9PEZI|nr:hypothetical protein F5X68DRAFT_193436 [Plectosphaerella plurivora]
MRFSRDDLDLPVALLDPETSQLLPPRKKKHRVRVQGRLAVVRSVSTANLGSPTGSGPPSAGSATPRFESGVGGHSAAGSPRRGRRRSLDDGSGSEMEEEEVRETAVRDRQLRGYGIGGAGNIRRPTDVYGSSSRSDSSPDKRWWNGSLRDLIGRVSERKGKTPAL